MQMIEMYGFKLVIQNDIEIALLKSTAIFNVNILRNANDINIALIHAKKNL